MASEQVAGRCGDAEGPNERSEVGENLFWPFFYVLLQGAEITLRSPCWLY